MKNATTKKGYARNLGQFFSPDKLVKKCISLIQNNDGRLLEPSCGNGAFNSVKRHDSVFIEIDSKIVEDKDVKIMNFFDYPATEKFDTIIGNPPYVDNSLFNVNWETDIKVQANLYLFFIEKCFHHLKEHGELIFIVPREFIKLTSAKSVNELLCKNGTITHYYDFGDEKLFAEACPNICIFRYEKGNFSNKTETFDGIYNLKNNNGIISFSDKKSNEKLGDYFEIKVGAVSGADKIFENADGEEFVYSKTCKTGELKKMLYQRNHEDLLAHKTQLAKRKIKKFSDEDWFMWGRPVNFKFGQPRIYVNCKTRNKEPFFMNSCERWDGSILALFPKRNMDLPKATKILNGLDWNKLGFMTGGRYLFTQKSLKEAPIDGKIFG